jgi:hypothetical protein
VPLRPGFTQEAHSFAIESLAQALAPATGTITCATNAASADGDTVTIGDGINTAVTYEYDKTGNGVTSGNVAIAVGTTAASNATALAALIVANQPAFTVVDNLAGVLTLTHKWPGVGGNITITKTGAFAATVTGMAGGSSGAVAATATQKAPKLPRAFHVSSVQLHVPAGFAADASNYWTIALKNGSTVVASWSTLSTAEGALTAATPVAMTNNTTDASLVFAAGDTPSLVMTKTGSPAALPLTRIDVHGEFVS